MKKYLTCHMTMTSWWGRKQTWAVQTAQLSKAWYPNEQTSSFQIKKKNQPACLYQNAISKTAHQSALLINSLHTTYFFLKLRLCNLICSAKGLTVNTGLRVHREGWPRQACCLHNEMAAPESRDSLTSCTPTDRQPFTGMYLPSCLGV